MKKIKITEANAPAIKAALDAINGKATAFTVHTFDLVDSVARLVGQEFNDADVPLNDRAGAMVTYQRSGPQAKSYKYASVSTLITIQVGADGKTCYLTDVQRSKVYPDQNERFDLRMTAKGNAHWLTKCGTRFGVLPSKTAALSA
jgi:hypothetical protein